MYESTFKLQRRPFSATPDPSCTYQAGAIQTTLDELVICLERGEGIAVLTAPAGLGKTLLCEKVKQELPVGFATILLRHAEFRTTVDLLRTLLIALEKTPTATSEQELRLQLLAALTELRRGQRFLAVICDEAHLLSEEVLEELRRLVDHADHGVPWARLLLAGQLELEEKLAGSQLSALNQRLRSHASLSPLSAQESLDYIDYRITWAGGRVEEVFHPDALTAVVEAADGNPRCLNQLCDHVLLLAYVAEQQPASFDLVQEALADLQHLPLTWNVRSQRTAEPRAFAHETEASAASSVEFGDHLATWEVTASSESQPVTGEVWEFGADSEDSPPSATYGNDPFENLLQVVEHVLEQREAEAGGQVQEEPVVDRYAAIDAGWPMEQFPAEPVSVSHPAETARPRWDADSRFEAADSRTTEPESRLHQDVLELATSARNAASSQRYDEGESSFSPPPKGDHRMSDAVETSPPPVAAERPFRNLFTRLRRKQKGLE